MRTFYLKRRCVNLDRLGALSRLLGKTDLECRSWIQVIPVSNVLNSSCKIFNENFL